MGAISPAARRPSLQIQAVFWQKGKNQSHVYPRGRERTTATSPSSSTPISSRFPGFCASDGRESAGKRRGTRGRRRTEHLLPVVCRTGVEKEQEGCRPGADGLHNCSELNSSLVAPPEITSPRHCLRHYFLRAVRALCAPPFRVYVLAKRERERERELCRT